MTILTDTTLASFLGSGIASAMVGAVIGAVLQKRNARVVAEVQAQFGNAIKVFESTRSWKQQILFELLGPMQMQFERTKGAFDRWTKRDLYIESKVVREGNQAIRDLLLSKGHLVPPDLMEAACQLIGHYDAWLQKYDEIRVTKTIAQDPDFVFTGPDSYPFPREAEEKFKVAFQKLQSELYGV